MKICAIIETESELKIVRRLFDQVQADIKSGKKWDDGTPRVYTSFDGLGYMDNEVCGEMFWTKDHVFYWLNEKGQYEIYNFGTNVKTVVDEGDVAGLMDSDRIGNTTGNFPF